jgi:hypothetical protein
MRRLRPVRLFAAALVLSLPAVASAQTPAIKPPSQDTSPRPAANPADVQSLDAILGALYDVISGPAGQKRDWDRFRSLFVPNARLIPTRSKQDGSGADVTMWSADDYATSVGPRLEQSGFFEKEIARKTETFGNVVHAFSTYESYRTPNDEKPFSRGINSIQLLKDGGRYWVVTIYWDSERAGNPIPEQYLPKR